MVTENKEQLIDIYDMWYEPFWLQQWFKTMICISLCVLILWLAYYLYTKYIQKSRIVDCSIVAYQDLDMIKKFHIATAQDSKNCYFRVSSIIKEYLACRYHALFMHLTDQEIVAQAALYMQPEMVSLLQRILQSMVFVKFEYKVAMTEKLEQDILLIKEFIEKTTVQVDSKGK